MTTLAPYDFEMSHINHTSVAGAHDGGRGHRSVDTEQSTTISESAALHVLASVTQKAKKLFLLMGTNQLQLMDEMEDSATKDLQEFSITYDALFSKAREEFIATSDTALKALLGEFRDHSLILGAHAGSTTESLWIPLRKERLANILKTSASEVHAAV
jgi:origin recognition complex subunit 2